MKILFFGDSITDAIRNRESDEQLNSYGSGFVMQIAGRLFEKSPLDYKIVNRGISGNRVVDLYARIKKDVWNEKPDVLSILIGVNSLWHEHFYQNGVDLERWEKVYRMLIADTQKVLPQTKIIICEPFCLHGSVTDRDYELFSQIKKYGEVAKKIAKEYGLAFLPLQKTIDLAAEKYGEATILSDGVHPTVQGAVIIAKEWLNLFECIKGVQNYYDQVKK